MRLRHTVRVVLAMRAGGVIRATPKDAARAAAFLQPALATSGAGVAFVECAVSSRGWFVVRTKFMFSLPVRQGALLHLPDRKAGGNPCARHKRQSPAQPLAGNRHADR